MEHHVNLVHNIPFFSVFFAMFCGIITPLLKSGRAARHLHGFMVGLVGILSVVLLANVVKNQEAYTFMMGHFSCTLGAMNCASPLEALLAVMVSVVMFLTITAGSRQIFEEIVPQRIIWCSAVWAPVCSCWVFVFFMASQGSSYSRR